MLEPTPPKDTIEEPLSAEEVLHLAKIFDLLASADEELLANENDNGNKQAD